MADLPTLLTLRTKTRQRADMVGSLFCTDAEINGYIGDSYKELYDLLVDSVEDYNLTSTTIAISSGNTFNLPSDFYKLRGLDDFSSSSNPITIRKFQFGERNSDFYLDSLVYRIIGSTIEILPASNAIRNYQLWYITLPVIPVADIDTINVVNGFDEYIIIDAAMKCLIKEESDISELKAQKSAMTDRIYRMRANRDQGLPEKVTRTRRRYGPLTYGIREF